MPSRPTRSGRLGRTSCRCRRPRRCLCSRACGGPSRARARRRHPRTSATRRRSSSRCSPEARPPHRRQPWARARSDACASRRRLRDLLRTPSIPRHRCFRPPRSRHPKECASGTHTRHQRSPGKPSRNSRATSFARCVLERLWRHHEHRTASDHPRAEKCSSNRRGHPHHRAAGRVRAYHCICPQRPPLGRLARRRRHERASLHTHLGASERRRSRWSRWSSGRRFRPRGWCDWGAAEESRLGAHLCGAVAASGKLTWVCT